MFRSLTKTQVGCRRVFSCHLLHKLTTLTKIALAVSLTQLLYTQEVNAQSTDKPNVIVIMADDIGFECYSAFGSEYYKTPHIDALAKSGVKFTQAYSQPICTPTRTKIMTGRYNFQNYTRFGDLNLKQATIGTIAQEAGYATAIAGKWQLSPGNLKGPHEAGFDEYCLWHFSGYGGKEKLDEKFKNKGSRFKSPHLFKNGELVKGTEGKYGPDIVSDYLCDFIERKKDKPFLIYYPMILVHNPFDPTPDSVDWNENKSKRPALDRFKDMVEYMDKIVGKIVKKLDDTGLRENTLIMVTGDNGTNTGITSPFPGRGEIQGGKGKMTDAGNRVAFVADWPGHVKQGSSVDTLIDFADVLPTISEAIGAKLPKEAVGESFLPLMKGDSSKARNWVFMSYSRNGNGSAFKCFVRDKDWKLYNDGSLYNVPNDWLEKTPVEGDTGKEARERLQPILDRILKDTTANIASANSSNPKSKEKKKKKAEGKKE